MSFEFLFGESTGVELRYVYDTIVRAEQTQGIAPELISELKRLLQRANDLYSSKSSEVAGEACHALFMAARSLDFTCDNRPSVLEASDVRSQRKGAGFSSGKERAEARKPVWELWQKSVDKVRSENPGLKPSRVYEIVGLEHNVTRQAVGQRVTWK